MVPSGEVRHIVRVPRLTGLRRSPLPPELEPVWWAFVRCVELVGHGRGVLLATLPVGRIEPAPIALGTAALRDALDAAQQEMPGWRVDELGAEWQACHLALLAARARLDEIDRIAASTDELDHVLEEVRELVEDLDPLVDAEEAFNRRWRVPTADRLRTGDV
jgi:hypothetical protein